MLTATQIGASWKELQELVESQAKDEKFVAGQPRFQFTAGKLCLIGMWQVEGRFEERGGHKIIFDRFGTQLGAQNFEMPEPGVRLPSPEVWNLTPVEGLSRVFWRFRAQDLSVEVLANRIMQQLKDFYEQYKLAAVV